MRTTAFATPTLVTKSDLQEVVRSWDGITIKSGWFFISEWTESKWIESEETGFITRYDKEAGTIHVYSPSHDMTEELDPEEYQELTLLFGSEPLTMITISVCRERGSDRLVQDFTQDLIAHFGGIHNYKGRWSG